MAENLPMPTLALITANAQTLRLFRTHLIAALVARGVRVLALAPNFDDDSRALVRSLGAEPVDCRLQRTGLNPVRDVLDTLHLARLLRRLRPDVVLGYAAKPVIYGSMAARLAGVPRRLAMVEGLGFAFTPSGEKMSVKRRLFQRLLMELYRAAFACAHRVVFLNPDDEAQLVDAGLLPASKAFMLGGIGLDLAQWQPAAPVSEPPTFLLTARLLREKGVLEFANAARIVKSQHPQARFILLGVPDEANPGSITAAQAQAWVDEGLLEWPGFQPVAPWLVQASVFVLPSFYREGVPLSTQEAMEGHCELRKRPGEGVPLSTQEAMAMARPVITTDAPGCRETVVDGVNGFLVPPRNAQALAQKMCVFIEQPELIASMGQASRRLAQERFDVHQVNERLIALILQAD